MIATTLVIVVAPSKGVTIAQSSVQTPPTHYVKVVQVQPTRVQQHQPRKQSKVGPSIV